MSTNLSAYQNIYFILSQYFVQNKCPPGDQQRPPPGGVPHSYGTFGLHTYKSSKQNSLIQVLWKTKDESSLPLHSLLAVVCVEGKYVGLLCYVWRVTKFL
jgi:hypothetical protein